MPTGDLAQGNNLPPNSGGDLVTPAPAEVGLRDYWILEAIRDLLLETNQFDDVYLSGLPENHGHSAAMLKVAVLEPAEWNEFDERDDPDDVQNTVRMQFRLTLLVRDEDPVQRDNEVDRLLGVCKNIIDGQDIIRESTIRGWNKLRKGKWERPVAPERRMTVVGEVAYFVDGETVHDELE